MGLFSKIKEKLGLGDSSDDAQRSASTPVADTATSSAEGVSLQDNRPSTTSNATTHPQPAVSPAASQVDVSAKLDAMAASHGETLNWRTSIVDLLKLLGLDSSLQSRKELASELGCPPDKMADSAQMNTWLHRTVMHKLAENGGNIPPELLS